MAEMINDKNTEAIKYFMPIPVAISANPLFDLIVPMITPTTITSSIAHLLKKERTIFFLLACFDKKIL